MSATVPNLWPDDFGTTSVTPPIAILRQQAGQLGKLTRNLVVAEVRTSQPLSDSAFIEHVFELVAPALYHYRFGLFTIRHAIKEPYPVTLRNREQSLNANDEQEFLRVLGTVLGSEDTRRVIGALLAQSVAE
jgi:hypothetical protein